jgi:hypothetical protein
MRQKAMAQGMVEAALSAGVLARLAGRNGFELPGFSGFEVRF